jgi:hypothetical protein
VTLPPSSQKLIFVNAANYLGPAFEGSTGAAAALNGAMRICFRAGPDGSNPFLPVPPIPNKAAPPLPIAGYLPGTGGVLPAKVDFSTTRLELYAMNAQLLASKGVTNTSCGDLFVRGYPDAGTLPVEGVDFVKLGAIPAGTFAVETTYVVAAEGCSAGLTDATLAAAKCGPTYDPATGHLRLSVRTISRGPVGPTQLGAQLVHATSAASTLAVNAGVAAAGGGAFKPFAAAAVAYGDPVTPQVVLAGVNLTSDTLSMNPALPGIPSYSFASAVAATSAGTPIALGSSHVFVVVGEVGDTTGVATRKLHFLGFPADPVVPPLVQ